MYRKYFNLATGVPKTLAKTMILRQSLLKPEKMHPTARKLWNQMMQPLQPLKYKLYNYPNYSSIYSPPLGVPVITPFTVSRTHTNSIPVYTDYKNDKTQKLTIIRNISGDINVCTYIGNERRISQSSKQLTNLGKKRKISSERTAR